MLINISEAKELSSEYEIPIEDILLIALNCTGANSDLPYHRARFRLKLNSYPHDEFYITVPLLREDTPFFLSQEESTLSFNGWPIGVVREVEDDKCDSTYFRRNKTELTLNSNSRSLCRGCAFCENTILPPNDNYNLTKEDLLVDHIKEALESHHIHDLSHFVDVTICTGCFNAEDRALKHILLVRKVLTYLKYNGELRYIGSEITSEGSLDIIEEHASPFALSLTVECFTRREQILREIKHKVTLDKAREILKYSVDKGFRSNILYIIGLDTLDIVIKEFEKFLPVMNRFPVINVFQPYLPRLRSLRDPEAETIEYYLKARKELEELFASTNLKPRPWENYRPLWYLTFGGEDIHDIRI